MLIVLTALILLRVTSTKVSLSFLLILRCAKSTSCNRGVLGVLKAQQVCSLRPRVGRVLLQVESCIPIFDAINLERALRRLDWAFGVASCLNCAATNSPHILIRGLSSCLLLRLHTLISESCGSFGLVSLDHIRKAPCDQHFLKLDVLLLMLTIFMHWEQVHVLVFVKNCNVCFTLIETRILSDTDIKNILKIVYMLSNHCIRCRILLWLRFLLDESKCECLRTRVKIWRNFAIIAWMSWLAWTVLVSW